MGKICDENRKTYIYVLEDPDTHEVRYVGKTVAKLEYRLGQHLYDSFREKTYKSNWIKKVLKNGKLPIIKLIETTTWDNSSYLEEYWIWYFKQHFNITNLSSGGEGALGVKRTEEQVQKLRESILKNSKHVYQYSTDGKFIKVYNNCVEAANSLNLRRENISQCCMGRKKSHGGFIWSYNNCNNFSLNNYIHISRKGRKKSELQRLNNSFVAKQTKIKIENIATGDIIISESMISASVLTSINKASICRECKNISINKQGKYKFSYYDR